MSRHKLISKGKTDISAYMVPAVDRAVQIMLLLANGSKGMTLAEIAEATGWHKSSIHKILLTLCHHGFLERDEGDKSYALGIELVRCSKFVLKNLNINQTARPFLKELADFSGETATSAILRGNKIVVVDTVESPGDLRVYPPIGTMDSVTAKSNGKAVLAWFPEEKIDEIIRKEGLPGKTNRSITDTEVFCKELAIVRKQGYAIDYEEFQEGISAVSAPVFYADRKILGTLSVIGPSFRMTKKKLHLYGKKCAAAAARLTPLLR